MTCCQFVCIRPSGSTQNGDECYQYRPPPSPIPHSENHPRQCLCLQIGDVKFGRLVGTDRNGNKYFENLEYLYGQHRWVEYQDIHNFEPTSVPPEWHGWLHHQTDATPEVSHSRVTGCPFQDIA
jgi:hypothetical protein